MITLILVLIASYLVLGIAADVLLHASSPALYWTAHEALIGHLTIIAVWPLALYLYLTDRE
jgi:hypothetical protein